MAKTKIVATTLISKTSNASFERLVPIIPEPITVATRIVVPRYSLSSAR
jgi:hypothetical protein